MSLPLDSSEPQPVTDERLELGRLFAPRCVIGVAKRRFGRLSDGGYVMLDHVGAGDVAISVGIGWDVSWDLAVADRGVSVLQFDPTVDGPPAKHPNFNFRPLRLAAAAGEGAVSLADALQWARDAGNGQVILKIDIEGDEWPVLDDVEPAVLEGFAQIVIEFHGFDHVGNPDWYARTLRVARKLANAFEVVHVHGNNFMPASDWNGFAMPYVLEVTYARKGMFSFAPSRELFPGTLDFPNNYGKPELSLGRFDFGARQTVGPTDVASRESLRPWLFARTRGAAPLDDLSDAVVDWPATIQAAGRDFALPMLATVVEETGAVASVPADVVRYLDYALLANAADNTVIRGQCIAIGAALAAHGMQAVLLKGAIWLFEDGPALGDRMMRDIDLLVPEGSRDTVERVLIERLGYRRAEWIREVQGRQHHGHPLGREDYPVTIEVHDALNSLPDHLRADEVVAEATPIFPGLAVPSLEHRMLHHAIASQVINADLACGVLGFRDAMDLGRLCWRAGDEVDWHELARDAERRGLYRALATSLHKASYVTGVAVPQPFAMDRAAQRHMRRCLLQRRWRMLDRVLRPIGLFRRAVAWHRDAFALELDDRRDFAAHLAVNRRRIERAAARLGSLMRQ